jgi:TnpA family transposase
MSRIKLLQPQEIIVFNQAPFLNLEEKAHYFSLSSPFEEEFKGLRDGYAKIGFILQMGYFKYAGRFYEVNQFHAKDIDYVIRQLEWRGWEQKRKLFKANYSVQIAYSHRIKILELSGWSSFEDKQTEFNHRIRLLIDQQLLPRKVLWKSQEYLFNNRIESPSYDTYRRAITQALIDSSEEISATLFKHLSDHDKWILDLFILRDKSYQKTEIASFRTVMQSLRPSDIKENVEIFKTLKDRLVRLDSLVKKLNLTDAVIDYHAHWASIADTQKLAAHSDKYLYLLCFLIHQVRIRNDYFMDTILQCVNSAKKYSERLEVKNYFENRKQRTKAMKLLVESRKDYKQQVEAIKTIVKSSHDAQQKVDFIEDLFEVDTDLQPEDEAFVALIEAELTKGKERTFHDIWENRSIWLSNRVGEIIQHLPFNSQTTEPILFQAITHFQMYKGKLTKPPKDISWLSDSEQDAITTYDEVTQKEKFRARLYKMLFFQALENGIKSGEIFPVYSYRYRSLEEYLIDKAYFQLNRQQLLQDADLATWSDSKVVMESLALELDTLFHEVNQKIDKGENPYFSINKKGKSHIETPKVEKPDTQLISNYFAPVRFVAVSTLLSEIEKISPLRNAAHLNLFGYQGKIQEKFRPSNETFFAALIAQGCNVGIDKMERIAKGIQGHNLKHIADWYLNQEALQDVNDSIIKFKNTLSLPDIHRKDSDKIHTASDGQKILVKPDSLNSSYSYKYPGFSKASVINTAIDERMSVFKINVISASEREHVNVVEMHLGNPVIKADTHSTDTHGSSDIVFGMRSAAQMYFLDIFNAPRLMDLPDRVLYSFEPFKKYAQLNYKLLPTKYLDKDEIIDSWDDILRLMVSLKLGKTTAYQVFKRLNSYAKQNPIEAAFKEFGRIIQTIFILKYYDDLALRQAIEKQLSHVELMNRFSKVVFFGQNQEFQVATKEEQERIILCRSVIQNAIVLWNYLYLSDLISKVEQQEEIEEIILTVRNSTALTWKHINFIGEYDFTNLLNNKELRFNMEKLKAWNYQKLTEFKLTQSVDNQ